MKISESEMQKETKYLDDTINLIRKKISELGQELYDDDEKNLEFKKFMWDSKASMDPGEMKNMMVESDLQVTIMLNKGLYLQKLYRSQNKPYFASIIFNDELIYMGITHVEDNLNYLVHDWRSPVCNLYYDYEVGEAKYLAPDGFIEGNLSRKRQYIIEDGKLLNIFDNSINISDELLQQVLATESSDKMKNIVNTIQKEQNAIIRNTDDKNLIVQGIAGSGKTSVALHRIAFLLYRIANLNSKNILIFSPNNIFTEYISNVLPELGEDNTYSITFTSFLKDKIKEYKVIEDFTSFIERYYKGNVLDKDVIKYKQSDEIIEDINNYLNNLIDNITFTGNLIFDRYVFYTKEELDNMLKNRYSRFPIFERIKQMSIKISEMNYDGRTTKSKSIEKELYKIINIPRDYKKIYRNFYLSRYSKYHSYIDKGKSINYEDACLFLYIKSILEGFDTNHYIKQVVIDEAQDYTKLQYLIIKNTFKTANYTILGDVNQTINPYYKYDSLEVLKDIFDSSKYLELNKTYRSTSKIIGYTNNILGLEHVSAIRNNNARDVVIRNSEEYNDILNDLNDLIKISKSVAIITKDNTECDKIYDYLKDKIDIVKIDNGSDKFSRKLVIVPSYIAKGLEFDSVIVYTSKDNKYTKDEKYLFYVACTRSQHNLIVYNQ